MKVNVQLFSILRKYAPDSSGDFEMELPAQSDIRCLLEKIGIPPDLGIVFFLNGRHAEYDTSLKNNDTLIVHLIMGGG